MFFWIKGSTFVLEVKWQKWDVIQLVLEAIILTAVTMFYGLPIFPKLPIFINCKRLIMSKKKPNQLSASITSISRKRERLSNRINFKLNNKIKLCMSKRAWINSLKCVVMSKGYGKPQGENATDRWNVNLSKTWMEKKPYLYTDVNTDILQCTLLLSWYRLLR